MSEIFKLGIATKTDNGELMHHGILGMKWGVRRYQNKDGSLTAAGKKRYLNDDGTLTKKGEKELNEAQKYEARNGKSAKQAVDEQFESLGKLKKGSKEKAKAEEDILRKASVGNFDEFRDSDDNRIDDDFGMEESEIYGRIAGLVDKNFGSFYEGRGATPAIQKMMDDYSSKIFKAQERARQAYKDPAKKTAAEQEVDKLKHERIEQLSKEALKAIGFEITDKNLKYIGGWLVVD